MQLRVPDLGESKGVAVIDVLVKPGDRVEVDTPLVTLESDKATMDVPSTAGGTIGEVFLKTGDKVDTGTVIATLVLSAAAAEAAGAEVDVALAESLASRREVLLQLRTLFWGLAYEQARVGVLETLVAQTTKLAQTVQRRVETGEVRPVEAPLVEIELPVLECRHHAGSIRLAQAFGQHEGLDGAADEQPLRRRQHHPHPPFAAGRRGFIDDVIHPHSTRRRICKSLAMLKTKECSNPWKKHDNIPL